QEDVRGTERGPRLAPGLVQGRLELVGCRHCSHPPPAATHCGFDHDRVAELVSDLLRFLNRLHWPVAGGQHWYFCRLGDLAGGHLVAELVKDLRSWADEGNPGSGTGASEPGVLGEEAVPGVNGVGADLLREPDDPGDVEVSADRLARLADRVGFVR